METRAAALDWIDAHPRDSRQAVAVRFGVDVGAVDRWLAGRAAERRGRGRVVSLASIPERGPVDPDAPPLRTRRAKIDRAIDNLLDHLSTPDALYDPLLPGQSIALVRLAEVRETVIATDPNPAEQPASDPSTPEGQASLLADLRRLPRRLLFEALGLEPAREASG